MIRMNNNRVKTTFLAFRMRRYIGLERQILWRMKGFFYVPLSPILAFEEPAQVENKDFMKAKFSYKQGGVIGKISASRSKELWGQQVREKP